MLQIGILSDTHGYIPPQLYHFFDKCDEIWHAGDWGDLATFHQLKKFKPVLTVFGNIDGQELRREMPEVACFTVEETKVLMLHIGGYPSCYNAKAKQLIAQHAPNIVVCGHSHILKVVNDKQLNHLHINPGAAGYKGFHQVSTAIRFRIEQKRFFEMEVWEMPKNSLLATKSPETY